jgi:uncharacterized damage-inducible protein DinB
MIISADVLRSHLAYSDWASRRIVTAAATLTEEELHQSFETADGSVLGTLVHVFAADRVWLARVNDRGPGLFISDADRKLEVLKNDWPALYQRWHEWASSLNDGSAQQIIAYRDLKGRAWEQPLWQIILHVVNHGTHHRGQAAGFIRALGHVPPPLDLIAYYREYGQ